MSFLQDIPIARVLGLFKAPRRDRTAKVKRAFWDHVSQALYRFCGPHLNGWRGRLMLQHRPDCHYNFNRFSDDYARLFSIWLEGNVENNCGDLSRFYGICLNVTQICRDQIPGDFVELGVYKGNSAGVLATFARQQNRRLFLFDTFGGFDNRDLQGIDAKRPQAFCDTSIDAVRNLVGAIGVTFVQGYFPDSIQGLDMPAAIAVAHIDCDLYAPIKAGLESFYPRLSPGGILVVHDYSSGYWSGATAAVDEFCMTIPEKPVLLSDKCGTVIIRKKTM
jgi:hypothetical protein